MHPYTVTQINECTWQIAEVYHLPAALPMYLIVGSERAALIDTGTGMEGLREAVEEITKLPVSVYNTHAHLDHAAGNNEFDRVYMHPEEEIRARFGQIYDAHLARRGFYLEVDQLLVASHERASDQCAPLLVRCA